MAAPAPGVQPVDLAQLPIPQLNQLKSQFEEL